MHRKPLALIAVAGVAIEAVILGSTSVLAQDSVPVSVSLSAPEDFVARQPNVEELSSTGMGIPIDAISIALVTMIVLGIALIYFGTLSMRRSKF